MTAPVGWVSDHQEITPPANFHHFRDTTSLIFAGQTYIAVGLSAIINALTPLFAVLVMASFAEERLTANRLIGVVLGVAGVGVLRGVQTGPDTLEQTIGIALCAAGALAYGFAALWGRRQLAGVAPLKSATCQLLASTLMMAVLVAVWDRPWTLTMPGAGTWASLIALAIFGTALAYLVFFRILVRAGASNVMLVTLLVPISAMVLGHVFLDEVIRGREIARALIIGAGLLFIDGRAVAWARRAVVGS